MKNLAQADEALVAEARILTGVKAKKALLRPGLEALIARESAKELLQMEGKGLQFKRVPRRRTAKKR